MKNLQEVLQQKEMELTCVRREIEALRSVVPLLVEADDQFGNPSKVLWPETPPTNRWPLEVDKLPQASSGL